MIVMSTLGCSDGEESLQGWKESDVEIINEGSATGTTRQIVAPGDPLTTPLTATDVDTTATLELTDEALEGDFNGQTAEGDAVLGDRLPDPRSIPLSPGRLAPSPRPSERSATQSPAPSGSTPAERRVTTPRTAPDRPERSEGPDEREPLPQPRRPAPEPEPEDVEPKEPAPEQPDPESSQPERERDVEPEPPDESETEEQDPPPAYDTEENPDD